jgi:hypothetical protein
MFTMTLIELIYPYRNSTMLAPNRNEHSKYDMCIIVACVLKQRLVLMRAFTIHASLYCQFD